MSFPNGIDLARWSVARPRLTLFLCALPVLAALAGLPGLTFRTEGHALVPEHDARVRVDRDVRSRFGVGDPVIVLVTSADPRGIYNPATLRLVASLTEELSRVPGLAPSAVLSLATEKSNRLRPDGQDFRLLLADVPEDPALLDSLRAFVRSIDLYRETLVARDERAAAIYVEVPEGPERERVVEDVLRVTERAGTVAAASSAHRISVIGPPVAEALLGEYLLSDLGRLLPLAILVMMVVFLAAFGTVGAMALPLLEVAACLLFVFGLMGWFGVPVTLPIVVLPVILTAVGVADEIHIFHRFREHWNTGAAPREAVTRTVVELWGPVARAALTTVIGFLSFAVSPLAAVRAFGLFSAVGVVFCLLFSLTAIPALLVLVPERLLFRRGSRGPRAPGSLAPFTRWTLRHRGAVLLGAALLALVAGAGILRLRIQDSWTDGFPAESGFARDTRAFDRNFRGAHVLLAAIGAPDSVRAGVVPVSDVGLHELTLGPVDTTGLEGSWIQLLDPAAASGSASILARIVAVQEHPDRVVLATDPFDGPLRMRIQAPEGAAIPYEIRPARLLDPGRMALVCGTEAFLKERAGGVLGPCELLTTTAYLTSGRRESQRRMPEQPARLRQLWTSNRHVRGEERFREVMSPHYDETLVRVFLKDANYVDTGRLLKELEQYQETVLAPAGLRLRLAGDVAVSQALIDSVVTTQVLSAVLSLAGIFALTAVLWRSLRGGILGMLPSAVALLCALGMMGWMGIPLGVATSMFTGITVGIGVDYAIHLRDRYRSALERGLDAPEALADAATATGPAVLVHGLSLGLGFGVLLFSKLPANARLGGLLTATLLGCLVATLLLLPPLELTLGKDRRR